MKEKIVLFILALFSFNGCTQTSKDEIDRSYIKEKYNFKPLANTTMPNELMEELFIPFYKNGKYYFSNYNGTIINKQGWEEIEYLDVGKMFWGRKDNTWSLYKFPDVLLIDRKLTQKEFKKLLGFKPNEIEHPEGNLYSIRLKSEITWTSSEKETKGELVAEPDKGKTVSVEEIYYFSKSTKLPVKKSYIKPNKSALKDIPHYKPTKYSWSYGRPYLVTLNFDLKYCLIDFDGNEVFKNYVDIIPHTNTYVALLKENGKQVLGNVETGKIVETEFDAIKKSTSCYGFFIGSTVQSDGSKDLFLINPREEKMQKINFESEIKCSEPSREIEASKEQEVSYFRENGKYGVKDAKNNILLKPTLNRPPEIFPEIGWICIKNEGEYGVMDFNGKWNFPMEKRKVFYTESPWGPKYTFALQDNSYTCFFNKNMELIGENHDVFMSFDKFDQIPKFKDQSPSKLNRPSAFREYLILSDDEYGHVYTANGKYVSSHKGKHDEDFWIIGLPREKQYKFDFVPVSRFVENRIVYYVRLTDGFEFRE